MTADFKRSQFVIRQQIRTRDVVAEPFNLNIICVSAYPRCANPQVGQLVKQCE
jgi:hypothetical protein